MLLYRTGMRTYYKCTLSLTVLVQIRKEQIKSINKLHRGARKRPRDRPISGSENPAFYGVIVVLLSVRSDLPKIPPLGPRKIMEEVPCEQRGIPSGK